ncbi:Metalloprotease [Trametes coccinea BRFM310]|uniref:Metalloprotease n=1 Tax=Trametes coccinea (strain BRFM310) TaxID=1353009 RepID=A0A1Y2J1P1_TRAC3|nr:Metalloprotease [Trametes coccinea BRFM310]
MAALIPPQAPLQWNHTPEDILRLTKEAIAEYRAVEDRVAALAPAECTFESVFLALALAYAKRQSIVGPLEFYQNVSTSQALRDASTEAESLIRDFRTDSSMRLDVFRAQQAAQKNIKESGKILSPEEQRLVDKVISNGARAGLALPDAEREKLSELKKQLEQACVEFSKNVNEEKGIVTFSLEELKGVPQDAISGFKKRTEGGKELYEVTFKMTDFGVVNGRAEIPETRRVLYEAFENRVAVNVPVLDKVLDLRRQIATLLGYETWADYATEVKLVKTAQGVENFLNDLQQRLRPIGLKDRAAILALKQKECEEKGYPFDGELYAHDYNYYSRQYVEQSLSLDSELLKQYFPVSHVVSVTMEIYQELLGLKFVEVDGANTWHPDARVFAVWEKDATDESGFVGYYYIDLYPRESKFPHAAVWPIIPGYEKEDGARNYPVAAIVANLSKPTPDKPALMKHFDVKTFFHEMGHIFHELLSRTKFARFHGTTVAGDFMEAPSQMLENWCFEPKVLTRMSSHYETKKPLDTELVDKVIRSRYVNVGMFNLRQITYAMFDLQVHMAKEHIDCTKLWCDLRESISLLKSTKYLPGHAGFQHIIGDYNVGYYGYFYSDVFAADMYATVFKDDPLDPARGRQYREKILLPGSSKDEMDMLQDFLGREPNSEAFVKQLFGMDNA